MRLGMLALSVTIGLTGCGSFRTQAIDRCENDTIVVNPEAPLKGVPVTLRVPTHLDLKVIQTTYWQKTADASGRPTLETLSTCRPTRTLKHDVCYTEKVFLVDPVKPGAGTSKYGFTFASEGTSDYDKDSVGKGTLRNVKYKIQDETILRSSELLASSLNFINAFKTSANEANRNREDLIATDNVIAYARFDLNSPSYEADVAQFLECHLNNGKCGPCPVVCDGGCPSTTP